MQLSRDEVAEVVQHFDGWNFRQVARFAEEVIRRYVSSLNLSLLEASDPPLPQEPVVDPAREDRDCRLSFERRRLTAPQARRRLFARGQTPPLKRAAGHPPEL